MCVSRILDNHNLTKMVCFQIELISVNYRATLKVVPLLKSAQNRHKYYDFINLTKVQSKCLIHYVEVYCQKLFVTIFAHNTKYKSNIKNKKKQKNQGLLGLKISAEKSNHLKHVFPITYQLNF